MLYWKVLKYKVFVFEEVFVKNPDTLRSPSEIFGTSGRIGDVRATSGHRSENFRKFSAAGGYQNHVKCLIQNTLYGPVSDFIISDIKTAKQSGIDSVDQNYVLPYVSE